MMVAATNFAACSSDDENKQSENYANATIHGTVVNFVTGETIPTATVELYQIIITSKYLVATTITGTDGFFSFQNIGLKYEETYFVTVSHPDYQSYSHTVKLKPGSKLEINASMQPKSSK